MLQIWTRDMVPELMAQQGRDTARAIEGFGANIGNSLAGIADRLEKRKEEEKRINTQARAVEGFLGAMTDEDRRKFGVHDMTEFKNRDSRSKIEFGMGLKMRQEFDQGQLARDRFAFEKKQAEAARKAAEDADRAIGEALQRRPSVAAPSSLPPASSLPPVNSSPFADPSQFRLRLNPAPAPALPQTFSQSQPNVPPLPQAAMPGAPMIDAQSLLRAAAQNPNILRSPNFNALLRAAATADGVRGADTFIEDDVTGARFLSSGNTRLPSGVNPSKMTTVIVMDPNTGEPVELPINPRTGQPVLKPRPPQNAPRVSPDFTKSLGELAIGLDDPKNGPKVRSGIKAMIDSAHTLKQLDDDQRTALYSQFGIDGTAPAAAPATGERVTVEKDGKKFTLPKAQLAEAQKQGYKLSK